MSATQQTLTGDTFDAGVLRVPLTGRRGDGLVALVDPEDVDLIAGHAWRADLNTTGLIYARTGKGWYMHAVIAGARGVDHRNGNGLDNRRANLRIASASQNQANKAKRWAGTSRYKGVAWHARLASWQAAVTHAGRKHHLGYFADETAAALAYDTAARELFGEFVCPNFPAPGERAGCPERTP